MADQLNTLAKSANKEFVTRSEGGQYIVRLRNVDIFKGTLGEATAFLRGWIAGTTYGG